MDQILLRIAHNVRVWCPTWNPQNKSHHVSSVSSDRQRVQGFRFFFSRVQRRPIVPVGQTRCHVTVCNCCNQLVCRQETKRNVHERVDLTIAPNWAEELPTTFHRGRIVKTQLASMDGHGLTSRHQPPFFYRFMRASRHPDLMPTNPCAKALAVNRLFVLFVEFFLFPAHPISRFRKSD